MNAAYQKLVERIGEIGRLEAIQTLLEWDQETCMPAKATPMRAEETALLAGLIHERRTSAELGDLLNASDAGADGPVAATNIRETRRLYERAVKVPTELVKEISHTTTMAKEAWLRARKDSSFPTFAPWLEKLTDLKRRVADLIGYDDRPYDALLDEFEPGARTADIAALFAEVREFLVPLVKTIAESKRQPDASILTREYPRAAQEALCRQVAEAMGYDFDAGRLDVSAHPFTLGMTCWDVRITTRYDERYLPSSLFGTIHEVGHALYEQGLEPAHAFTPMGQSVSLGVHESQSRMWENLVGRSREFWEHHLPIARTLFPRALGGVSLDDFHAAVNAVRPSLIRVEADEVTYNLHVMLRFELEQDLLDGKLVVRDVPDAWNARMSDFLGLSPPDDATGCLQDIHWSMGAFGYFPTYALGNLFAAQFFDAARRDMPDLPEHIRRGEFRPLLAWLRNNIHRHGQRWRADELIRQVSGRPLSTGPFATYIEEKFKPLYGL